MAECLYYGDKPIGLIQSNAEDVEYSTGVSVKDKIDDIIALNQLTVTRVANDLTDSLDNWRVREKNGIYYLNINFVLKAHSATSDFVQVGTISNYSSLDDINLNVSLQHSSSAMAVVNIRPTGNIYVYIPQALSVNMFCRTTGTTIKS